MFTPDAIKWDNAPPSLPKGSKLAVFYGDPSKDGMFVIRAKLPANYRIAAHSHPTDEVVTVLSGTLMVGMGDKLVAANAKPFPGGSLIVAPRQDPSFRAYQAAGDDRGVGDGAAPVHLGAPRGRPEQEVVGSRARRLTRQGGKASWTAGRLLPPCRLLPDVGPDAPREG